VRDLERVQRDVNLLLTTNTSVLQEASQQDASMILPEQIKERVNETTNDTRNAIDELVREVMDAQGELRDEVDHSEDPEVHSAYAASERISLEQRAELIREGEYFDISLNPVFRDMLRLLGGDTRDQMVKVYNEFDFSTYWFQRGFGYADKEVIIDQLQRARQQFRCALGDLKVLDVGTGNGRIMKMCLDEIKDLDPNNANNFANNIKGFDLVGKVVRDTRKRMRELGLPEDAVFEGDFLNLPDEHQMEAHVQRRNEGIFGCHHGRAPLQIGR